VVVLRSTMFGLREDVALVSSARRRQAHDMRSWVVVTPTTVGGYRPCNRTSRFTQSEEAALRVGRRASLAAARAAPDRGPRCVRRSDAHRPCGRTASPARETSLIGRPTGCTPSGDAMRTTVRCAPSTSKNSFFHSYDAHRTVGRRCSSVGRSTAPVGRCASLSRWMHCIGLIDLVLPRGRCRSCSWKTRVYGPTHCIIRVLDPWRPTEGRVLPRGRASSSGRRCVLYRWRTHVFPVGKALHTMG
jgi:hypothetical protein